MYKTILVTLDGTPTDRAIIDHVKTLAKLAQGRVVLLHVADGWAARTHGADAISAEITEDTAPNLNPRASPPMPNWLTATP
jgi:nucleotide-binding universal stress UspA family protein